MTGSRDRGRKRKVRGGKRPAPRKAVAASRPGPKRRAAPATRARRAGRSDFALAIDLGGTKFRAAVVHESGRILSVERRPTIQDRQQLLLDMESALRSAAAGAGVDLRRAAGLGIGTAGVVDPVGGRIVYAPNLPLQDVRVGDELHARTGLRTVVDNDGRVAAIGEYTYGALKRQDPMVCLFFGTGIGIGMVVGGQLVRGADHAAGEIGHTIFQPGGEVCRCGKRGCFESLAGGRHLAERAARELVGVQNVSDVVLRSRGPEPEAGIARRVLDEAATAAAVMTANLVTLLNPRALVMGGGVLTGWPELFDRIRAGLEVHCHESVREHLRVARSELDADALLLGAAALVWA